MKPEVLSTPALTLPEKIRNKLFAGNPDELPIRVSDGGYCVTSPAYGFICPIDLPEVDEFQMVCENGCYLFHPDDALTAKTNADKVKLIPELQATRDEAINQRDRALEDKKNLEGIHAAQKQEILRLEGVVDSRFTFGTVLGVAGGSLLVGTLAGVLIMVFAQ